MQIADLPAEKPLELRVAARPESVTSTRKAAGDYAARAGCDRASVELAVAEAVGNSVIHGYPDGREGEVVVRAQMRTGYLVVEVSDDGAGMHTDRPSPGLGLGLALIARLSDEFTIKAAPGGGALVSMRFRA
jgi:anti-sigma regulatory factor (Ser/Thr protein kinase)